MYSKILHDIQQAYYQDNYANDGQRFVAWYLRNIHGLNTVEAKDCITDGANDKQIDAVYINNQDSTIYIIQGKFMSGEYIDAEPVREVLSSWILVQDLDQLQDAANLKLKVKINEISAALDDDYEICFELITTAKLTDQAQMDADAFSKKLSDSEELNANFVVVDNEMLKVKYDEALNKTNNYINFTFQLESGKYLEVELNGTRAVLAAIPLKDCVNIPGIKDGRLFRKNVRQSLGNSNKVNKGIAKTIKKEPGDFFFYHNGITAICSKIDIQNGQLTVKDLNIVNGCQSLSTIFVNIAGKTLNRAFKNANSKAVAENRVFSPQNWIKSKASIVTLTEALRVRLDAMEDDETNLGAKIQSCCKLEKQDFESRWTAD